MCAVSHSHTTHPWQNTSNCSKLYLSSLQREPVSLSYHLVIDHLCFHSCFITKPYSLKVTILHCDLYTRVSVALNMGAIKSKLACHLPKWFQDNNVKELQPGSLKRLASPNLITQDRTTVTCVYVPV